MTPSQKHAIHVMIDSIQSQLTAVKTLLAAADSDAAPAGKSVKIRTPDESVLTDEEDEKLKGIFEIPEEMRTLGDALLHSMLEPKKGAEG